jgi:AcrR family transcriptional regulator
MLAPVSDVAPDWKAKNQPPLQDRILEAAGEVMEAEGIDALRLERVARVAGCSRSSLYRYFDTKEALVVAVLERRVITMAQRMHIELESISDAADRLIMGIVRAIELAQSDPQFTVLFSEPNSPTVIRIAGTALPQLLLPVIGMIIPLADGLLPDDVPTEEAARWVVMIVVGLLTFDSGRAADREALVPYLERFLIPSLTGAGKWQRSV